MTSASLSTIIASLHNMNTNFNNWKQEEQIDPTFERPHQEEYSVEGVGGSGALAKSSASQPEAPEKRVVRNRIVSNTKRAAQNRSAQKAFRQRKERYIKDLEAQAAEVTHLKQTIEELKAENLQLRDYTIMLQSKLIELGPQGHMNSEAPPPVVFNQKQMFNGEK